MRLTETLCSSELCSEGTIAPAISVSDQALSFDTFRFFFLFFIVQPKCVVVVSKVDFTKYAA
jgi:hypothetical protein